MYGIFNTILYASRFCAVMVFSVYTRIYAPRQPAVPGGAQQHRAERGKNGTAQARAKRENRDGIVLVPF